MVCWVDVYKRQDPFNAVIITEATGKIEFESVVENVTYKVESDEATGPVSYTHLRGMYAMSTVYPAHQ